MVSRRVLFAIEAVLDVAYHGGDAPVRSTDLTERKGIPTRYLEAVLQELVREGILMGTRGPSGGYRLARLPNRINLGDIVRAIGGLETTQDPIADPAGDALGFDVVRPLFIELRQEMMRQLDRLSLADLCARAKRAGIEARAPEAAGIDMPQGQASVTTHVSPRRRTKKGRAIPRRRATAG